MVVLNECLNKGCVMFLYSRPYVKHVNYWLVRTFKIYTIHENNSMIFARMLNLYDRF